LKEYFEQYLDGVLAALEDVKTLASTLAVAADRILERLESGGTIYFAGNGGSASDAQHLAAELMGKFALDRAPLRSVCLNTDTSVLTAVANDFGYVEVFRRQVLALATADDVVVLISTSGESRSVLAACEAAKEIGATTIALTGPPTSSLAQAADISLAVGVHPTCHVQECHIMLGQALCGYVEQRIFAPSP